MGTQEDDNYEPLRGQPPSLDSKSFQNNSESSVELESILSNTEVPFVKRLLPATSIELKLLVRLAGPAIVSYMINYFMSMSTQIFTGHLGTLELAAASLGNNGVQTFAYGVMSRPAMEAHIRPFL
ncbi:hypothetical protein RJ639_028934 [Escallonia herrerae]|uniref:Uncharacterized protein n=1 Tax=Escallonia herrerae TaxID=1293975 RepID=A0AA88X5N9_9ASTE|nr:hypothetical protein RJ639_028934 [Escallonia herrerae]